MIAFRGQQGGASTTRRCSRRPREASREMRSPAARISSSVQHGSWDSSRQPPRSALGARQEPAAGHIVGRSPDMALMFYQDVLALAAWVRNPTGTRPGRCGQMTEVWISWRFQEQDRRSDRPRRPITDRVASDCAHGSRVGSARHRKAVLTRPITRLSGITNTTSVSGAISANTSSIERPCTPQRPFESRTS